MINEIGIYKALVPVAVPSLYVVPGLLLRGNESGAGVLLHL